MGKMALLFHGAVAFFGVVAADGGLVLGVGVGHQGLKVFEI